MNFRVKFFFWFSVAQQQTDKPFRCREIYIMTGKVNARNSAQESKLFKQDMYVFAKGGYIYGRTQYHPAR